ncbi:MAG TPA: restriction endonuclease [Stenomitos sp.]
MSRFEQPISITPQEYELEVKKILDASRASLIEYDSSHLETVNGVDGEYIIDVVARFTALDVKFLVLVECKHHKRKVERKDVQVLHSKLQSVGAQKAILFSVSGFQEGAIDYAKVHGIALAQFCSGSTSWFTKSIPPSPPPAWAGIPQYVAWWHRGNNISLLSEEDSDYTRQLLGLEPDTP